MTNTKTKALIFGICTLTLFCHLCLGIYYYTFAQDNEKLVALTKKIIEANTDKELFFNFEELKELYFQDNKYSEFIDILRSLTKEKKTLEPFINYYIALARYHQLKYLEKIQNWNEYFLNLDTYRQEILNFAQKTISSTASKDSLNLYAKLLLWRFYKDQEDFSSSEKMLSELINASLEYSKISSDKSALKLLADTLSSYGERTKAKNLYQLYVDGLLSSSVTEKDLKNFAFSFYEEKNLELAQVVYNNYIERIINIYPKEEVIRNLVEIAKLFAYKDKQENDPFYAESIFKKIEALAGKDIFDEELIYLRAYNLEKAKDYLLAKELYIDLINRFPSSRYADEAVFKVGIISAFILADIETAKNYFEKLAKKENLSPQVITSLYQLGLLNHWLGNIEEARTYYQHLIDKAGNAFPETLALAKERLKEIEESRPIEYNLKTFLDFSLKEKSPSFTISKIDLKAYSYRARKEENITITCTPYTIESGCLSVELQYLWSGDLGTLKSSPPEPTFNTSYTEVGTKEINLLVVSPSGILEKDLIFIEIE